MYDEIIGLRTYEKTDDVNEYGDNILKPITREIFAQLISIGTKEFYQAQTVGIKPEIKFLISDYLDYQDEEEVVYNDKIYKVLRTYRKTTDELEITCYGGVRNVGTTISNQNN